MGQGLQAHDLTMAARVFGLMMEEAQASHRHGNSIFIARFDDIVVADRTTGLSDVIDAAAMSSFDVVAKGEESVAAEATPWS